MVETMFDYLDRFPQIYLSEEDGENAVKMNQSLEIIWNLAEIFIPGNQIAKLKAPSYRLAELRILSDRTSLVVEERMRQGQTLDMNIVTLEKKDEGIEIIETYRDGNTIYNADPATLAQGAPSQLRRDGFTIERFFLKRGENSQLNAQLSQGALDPHYHELVDDNEIGSVAVLNGRKPDMKSVPITPKALNTTIALLIEGTGRGRADKYFNVYRA